MTFDKVYYMYYLRFSKQENNSLLYIVQMSHQGRVFETEGVWSTPGPHPCLTRALSNSFNNLCDLSAYDLVADAHKFTDQRIFGCGMYILTYHPPKVVEYLADPPHFLPITADWGRD